MKRTALLESTAVDFGSKYKESIFVDFLRDWSRVSKMADEDSERKEFDWDLQVNVPSIGVHRTLRVTSNESVGAVMIKLATKLGKSDLKSHKAS